MILKLKAQQQQLQESLKEARENLPKKASSSKKILLGKRKFDEIDLSAAKQKKTKQQKPKLKQPTLTKFFAKKKNKSQ